MNIPIATIILDNYKRKYRMDNKQLLSIPQIAKKLGKSYQLIWHYSSIGRIPNPQEIAGRVLYYGDDIDSWASTVKWVQNVGRGKKKKLAPRPEMH